jgi:hypothetical protein
MIWNVTTTLKPQPYINDNLADNLYYFFNHDNLADNHKFFGTSMCTDDRVLQYLGD